MTMMFPKNERCAVCGHVSEHMVIGSTNAFGPCDLDTRPPEMKRSTMDEWVQVCPECGYAAGCVSDETEITRDYLSSADYLDFGGRDPASDLAAAFLRKARAQAAQGKDAEAFFSYIHASWASDDAKDEHWKVEARKLALAAFDRIPEDDISDTLRLIRADLLRRSMQFERLAEEYATTRFGEEVLDRILSFELERAAAGDAACYTLADVPMPAD